MAISVILIVLIMISVLYVYNQVQFKKAEESYPPAGKFITVDHYKLHYISEGTGQPVVFLHGGILSCTDFKDVVQLAAKQGYHAIAFDRPGYGYSERPKDVEITPISQAAILHKALKELGVDKPIILVGHSWSGTMTLSYAMQFSDEVAGIVILAGAMYKEGYPTEHGDVLSKVVITPILGKIILKTLLKTPLAKGMATSMVKETFAPERVPDGYKEEVYALGFRPSHFRANREDVLAFPKTSKNLCEKYKEITVPTVIVVGEEDPFGTIEQAERLKKDIPHAIYKVIPNIGHMIPKLHPKIVMDNINVISKIKTSFNK
ncbi:pimeloyl-ACP methyl ester carboxylesterase [Anoxybacillus calidus]|jgi:pimeloyl-ACP methyl ester carboxylesterase|uniref:Pimeloyl-ACP methyl ester carboxylesterase n=1 Tax=[Anoxybacillus] calidus TaxID=575178 RepID=A0A7V9YZ27_9BACL|nr:alpha/beta hydrolase [Anoxybacillus calidus]MBA2870905.1 pimeloyl-ACP methyl ester carboxylesterase [Anoxybacillus calidus]